MSEYIDRGLRRSRGPVLPVVGAAREDDEGRFARFSLRVENEVITDVRFQASPCVTLVAYCEVAAEWVTGQTLSAAARRVRPADLSVELSLVPAAKRTRALLASRALIADDRRDRKGRSAMKVAYIFATQRHTVSYVLGRMILPQLEANRHGADVVGMFFFEDNNYVLVKGNPIGERLHAVAKAKNILLMGCDQCCYEREIADTLFDGVPIGCFPDLYGALAGNMPDHVITL